MQRTVLTFAFLTALLIPAASAGSPESPEVSDPAGDVDLYPGAPLPAGVADAVDIVATWFHDESTDSLQLTMQVTKLTIHPGTGTVPMSMLRLGTRFSTPYITTDSDQYWDNTWVASAIYTSGAWRAYLEPPSIDLQSQESTDVDFAVDEAANTVTLTLPRSLLGSPKAGDQLTTIHSLHDMDWPTYGVFFTDQGPNDYTTGGSYTFKGPLALQSEQAAVGTAGGAATQQPGAKGGASGSATTGGSAGSASATGSPDPGDAEAANADAQAQGSVVSRGEAPAKAPAPVAALLGLTLLALAARRQR